MASCIINTDTIKKIQDEMIKDMLIYGTTVFKPRDMMAEPVFRWYRGHDPYNSADDECFMAAVTKGEKP